MQVTFSRYVESDLDVIAEYIARHNPTRAVSFVEEIRQEFRSIGQNPTGYRLRPDLGIGIRTSAFGKYVIAFRIEEKGVSIRRVYHGGRTPPTAL